MADGRLLLVCWCCLAPCCTINTYVYSELVVLQALSSWSFPVASSSALVGVGLRGRLVLSQLTTMDLCAPLKARKLRLRRRNQLGGGHDQAEVPGIGAGEPVTSQKRKLAAVAASVLTPLLKQERAACAPNRPRMGITFDSLLKQFTDREFKDR